VQLLQGVYQVTEDRKAEELALDSFVEIDRLAAAFNHMASIVWERERRLKEKVAEMRIEIDTRRKQERLEAIVETDFFQRLEVNASKLRDELKRIPSGAD
jgi:hypothetical protein